MLTVVDEYIQERLAVEVARRLQVTDRVYMTVRRCTSQNAPKDPTT